MEIEHINIKIEVLKDLILLGKDYKDIDSFISTLLIMVEDLKAEQQKNDIDYSQNVALKYVM